LTLSTNIKIQREALSRMFIKSVTSKKVIKEVSKVLNYFLTIFPSFLPGKEINIK